MRISDWSSDVCSSDLPQLFDLEADPDEYVDLGESPAHEDARAAMAARLLAWLKQRRVRTTISNEDVEKRTGNAKSRGILFGVWVRGSFRRRPDRKRTRLNSSNSCASRIPSST